MIAELKREMIRLERMRGKAVLMVEDRIVTAYRFPEH